MRWWGTKKGAQLGDIYYAACAETWGTRKDKKNTRPLFFLKIIFPQELLVPVLQVSVTSD
jgi:hypothetical protein